MNKASIIEFIAAGFKLENNKPAESSQCLVITDQLNVYKATYDSMMGFETSNDFDDDEIVIAWKYVKQKKS